MSFEEFGLPIISTVTGLEKCSVIGVINCGVGLIFAFCANIACNPTIKNDKRRNFDFMFSVFYVNDNL